MTSSSRLASGGLKTNDRLTLAAGSSRSPSRSRRNRTFRTMPRISSNRSAPSTALNASATLAAARSASKTTPSSRASGGMSYWDSVCADPLCRPCDPRATRSASISTRRRMASASRIRTKWRASTTSTLKIFDQPDIQHGFDATWPVLRSGPPEGSLIRG